MKQNNKSNTPTNLGALVEAAGAAINSIKLNEVTTARHRGHRLRVKRRRSGSEYIAEAANLFLPMANAKINVWADPKEWQRWEVCCYKLLNGEYLVYPQGTRTVCQEKLPGRNLRKIQKCGTLNVHVLEAAAREIRRAHRLRCPIYGRAWSHGDLHLGNVIYDERTDRPRLIDFELYHVRSCSAVARHADDLLAFLQDMVGRVSGSQWLPFARCFLDAYGRRRVIAALRGLLVVPNGVEGLWWGIRSAFYDRTKLKRRIGSLRLALEARAEGEARKPLGRKKLQRRTPGQSGRVR